MNRLFIIIFVFITFNYSAFSQADTTTNRLKVWVGLNPILFVDYTFHYTIDDFIPNWVTYGVDLNVNATLKRHTVELGVIAGDSYPVLHFLNYYVGYNYKISPEKWKSDILVNTKLMTMYYKDKSSPYITTVWQRNSVLLGGTIQKTYNRFQFGLSYYSWFDNHKFTQTYNSDGHSLYGYSKNDFGRTGLIVFKLNVLLTK